jgi:hypothetical protein
MFWMYGKREWHSRSTKSSLGSVLTTIFIFDKTHAPLAEIAPHWEKTMCYSCYGLPQGDYKRCVIPAVDSLKGITSDVLLLLGTPSNRITNDVLFLLWTPSRGLQTMCYSCYGLPQGDYK